ncbi:MAG TPA: HAMP domain-containing sensor histidine kinase, partial [Dongiaceae bacterium]
MKPAGESVEESGTDQFLRAAPGVPMAVVGWDSGVMINANAAMASLLGVPDGGLVGRSIVEFHALPERRALFLKQVERAGDNGAETEMELRRADGARIWVKVSARRILYGGTPALLVIAQDITAYKERERQLKDRLARQSTDLSTHEIKIKQRAAEAANRAKSLFLAHMSHELRSPLNSILGFSEMIRDLHLGPEQIEKYVQYGSYINQAGTHLLALIDDILDLAKIESGKLTLKQERFDLAELVAECARMMRPMAERGGLSFRIVASSVVSMTADRLRTKQMILNLASNAIKFTRSGGTVELAAEAALDGAVSVVVSDTGVGMTEAEIAIALQPFGRVESSVSDRTGTGL